jgi:hypothetical protein
MTPERWRQVETLGHSASGREPSGPRAFLDEACRSDAELRHQVESLLDTGSRENIIDRPVWGGLGGIKRYQDATSGGGATRNLPDWSTAGRRRHGGSVSRGRYALGPQGSRQGCAAHFSERFDSGGESSG